MLTQGLNITWTRYIFVVILGSVLIKRFRNFILDWSPFLFIMVSYDFLRNFTPLLNPNVHILEIPSLERDIFGVIPTVFLQSKLYHPLDLAWYDYFATIIYFFHFILWIAFGFILWVYNRSHFREFVTGISILSYAAWVTYIIYPAAPPWLIAEWGYLQGVSKIMFSTLEAVTTSTSLPTIYHNINPNLIAAIPSMHAAYPFLILLFCLRFYKWKGLFFLPYVFSVWFSIIYLGEHFVVDLVLGAFYALLSYAVAVVVLHRVNWGKVLKV